VKVGYAQRRGVYGVGQRKFVVSISRRVVAEERSNIAGFASMYLTYEFARAFLFCQLLRQFRDVGRNPVSVLPTEVSLPCPLKSIGSG
jgi:hypothetical protein